MNLDELERYQRQIALENIGYNGQKKLKAGRVLCVGAGGLGSALCLYLVAAGIGKIGIVDNDTISLNNLHRQILYTTAQCGEKKTTVAQKALQGINPHCNIQCYDTFLTENNAKSIITDYDIVADCSDNFATRYCVNHSCCALKIPNVFAVYNNIKAIVRFSLASADLAIVVYSQELRESLS